MMKVNNNKAVQEALSCDLLKTIISDVKDWAAALPYRANGKHRMANQILGLDGVLYVQSHFNQHRDKAPDYMSVELLALMSCVRLTGQEASKLLKAYQGEMFPAAALFLLRAGIDINKIPKLCKGFHIYPSNEWAADMDESFLSEMDYIKLPDRMISFATRVWKLVANLYACYQNGMDEQHPVRQARAQILNWIRYAIFQPSVTGLEKVKLSPKGVYQLLNCTVAAEVKIPFATIEQYRMVAEKLGAAEGDVFFRFNKEEVDLILNTPFVEDKESLGCSFGAGIEGFRKLHKQDRKMLNVGEWSACCQKLDGAGVMAIALCKASPKADTFAISVNGEDCGSMVVFSLSDGSFIIDSIERRKMLSDDAIEALLKKLASQHKLYAGYNLEGEFGIEYDTEDRLSMATNIEWAGLYTFAEGFYIDTCPTVWRIVP